MGNVTRPRAAPKRSNRNAEANEAKLREINRRKTKLLNQVKTMSRAHNNISKKIHAGTANVGDIATIQVGIPRAAREIKRQLAILDSHANAIVRRTLAYA